MTSRVLVTSKGSRPLRRMVKRISVLTRPRIFFDRVVEGQTQNRFGIQVRDQVARLDPGAVCGSVVNRRDHLDQAVFHGDFDAEAAELALGLHPHVSEGVGVQITRMRIE